MSLPATSKTIVTPEVGHTPEIKDLPLEKPGKNQVLVKIEYAPLNPTDIHSMTNLLGWSKPGVLAGKEGSGTVVAVGEYLKVPFNVGDRVHVFTMAGAMSQYYNAASEELSLIENNLSFEDAASHFINPCTVYAMGIEAQKGGHKAVIHTAGSSALGRMLIRYYKHLGIKLINVVRRDEYIKALKEEEGADYVLNMKAPNFEKELRELAEKEHATMAFEAVAGDLTNVIMRALPPGSICYVYGSLSFENVKNLDVLTLFDRKALAGFVFFNYVKERADKGELQQLYREVHALLSTIFKTKVAKVFKLEEINEALEYYREHSSKGKILVKPN